jgi:HD superfamily phosphodiesterase
MKMYNLATIINQAFKLVIQISKIHNIDESHSLKHSMEVFNMANKIYNSEVEINEYLKDQKDIICVSAILHDMCDKKYMDEKQGIIDIKEYMKPYLCEEKLDAITDIISTMSYSTVKKNGYPDLKEYQLSYHIVREADLLSAYDFDRCVIYGMMVSKYDYFESVKRAKQLFNDRVFNYIKDDLFITNYSRELSMQLHNNAITNLSELDIIHSDFML